MSEATGPALVWCPFPDAPTAVCVADVVLGERLTACANILPAMHSRYVWNGEHQTADEIAVLFKTDAALLNRLVGRLGELHPYDEPAILGWHCDAAHPATAAWLGSLTV